MPPLSILIKWYKFKKKMKVVKNHKEIILKAHHFLGKDYGLKIKNKNVSRLVHFAFCMIECPVTSLLYKFY